MPASFVMAGGGTGGHVVPLLAVARELRARGHNVVFIGVRRGIEAKLVPAEGFPIEWVEIGGLNRVGLRQMISSLTALPFSVLKAKAILQEVRPAAVFSLGGYVAGPVLLAAIWTRIPIVVMEPNAIPGFTHRKLARFITRALVSFDETAKWFPPGRTEVTGLPIREEFFAVESKPMRETVTVLITGGSQGSRTLNRATEESWPLWAKALPEGTKLRLIHQTGARMFEELAPRYRASGIEGEISAFLNMPEAFAKADIVVGRSGMGNVSELAAAGKPSILVPFPGASDDHQLRNAEAMQQAGAAKLVLDGEMNGPRLVSEVCALIQQPEKLREMSAAARKFARAGAAKRAAELLESLAP
ncbi:MAG: undecaprenyldiphospho-muramoylpentapeptide beta-N-acetylglucosaminyltransferase [Bryobacteraceae bacterium]